MSFISRLARPTHPVGRAYSFFSSKPGGGRHFVSAKPPKPVLQQAGRAKLENATSAGSAGSPPESSAASPPANASPVVNATPADDQSPSKPAETQPHPNPSLSSPPTFHRTQIHPSISSKEYKLHQFFSVHRPLLLLNQPTSTIFETVDPSLPLPTSSEHRVNNDFGASFSALDDLSESTPPDADADTARQLAHTLVMNSVGGAIAWQRTLSHLGLGVNCSENDMALAKESAQEWVTIHADSTRRKKRKKMKKHKLKKRRRLTRRQSK